VQSCGSELGVEEPVTGALSAGIESQIPGEQEIHGVYCLVWYVIWMEGKEGTTVSTLRFSPSEISQPLYMLCSHHLRPSLFDTSILHLSLTPP
jgi:hypothetical protein